MILSHLASSVQPISVPHHMHLPTEQLDFLHYPQTNGSTASKTDIPTGLPPIYKLSVWPNWDENNTNLR